MAQARRTANFERGLDDQIEELLTTINGNIDTDNLADKAVTLAKMADMATSSLLGRITAGDGSPEVLSAANALSILGLTGITSAWTEWTPSWTNLTVGNGTNEGAYLQIGKLVFFRAYLVFGSTTSISGSVVIATPTPIGSYSNHTIIGNLLCHDSSPLTFYPGNITYNGGLELHNATATYIKWTTVTATTPFTWATNDYLSVQGFYEAL